MGLKIAIHTDSSSIFIRPNEPDLPPETLNVFLTVATDNNPPSKVSKLELVLCGSETMCFTMGHFEQNTTMMLTKEVPGAAGLTLAPNSIYTFNTTFPIHHDIAGYQRCKYGRVYHRLEARMTCPGFLKNNVTKATKLLWLVPYPKDDSVFIYSYTAQGFSEGLGPILLSMNSAHFTVGGYMRILLETPGPASNVEIVKFQTSLLQRFTLQSRNKLSLRETTPEQRLVFLDVPGDKIGDGTWTARLPNDHSARPTSRLQDQPGITVHHAFEARIQYKVKAEGKEALTHTYRMEWPVDLPACCFQFASMQLPAYSKLDPCPVPEIPRGVWAGSSEQESFSHCVCGESMEYLLQIEATLAAAHNAGKHFSDRRQLHREVRYKVAAASTAPTTSPSSMTLPSSSAEAAAATGGEADGGGSRTRKPVDWFVWERRDSEEELCRLACDGEGGVGGETT
ncbi:hypothetical protein V8E36_009828 [Tilletia maclaganii]